ncbi:XRE family transcriptional regulator [Abiotrophia defectiva]|uniref:helix-turn-helix domain-containing protein n=1 Tax=Abiotrophia defectiva TaxID=46125 RepID=UPI0026EE155D|nr:XRE family transcriptional regulator [Abiotrophia defectiva]
METKMTATRQRQIVSNNLNELAKRKGVIPADLVRDLGIAEATIRSWFNGTKYPRIQSVQQLADYFGVPRSRITEEWVPNKIRSNGRVVRVPVLGTIACGSPILSEENVDYYEDELEELLPSGNVFYLKTKGDSMFPTIPDKSLVLIREQPSVENGEIAAVLVNGDTEATLKRVHFSGDTILLQADNPLYPPYIVSEENPARIIGKVIKYSVYV